MRINAGSALAAPSKMGSRKASLEKQIKRLERRRDQLMKKLAGQEDNKSSNSLDKGVVNVGGQTIGSPTTPGPQVMVGSTGDSDQSTPRQKVASQLGAINEVLGNTPSASLAEAMAPLAEPVKGVNSSLSALMASVAGSGGGGEMAQDPEMLQKQIESLNQIIIMLRQQLAQEEGDGLGIEPIDLNEEGDEEGSGVTFDAAGAILDASLPAPEVDAEGHVDGYA